MDAQTPSVLEVGHALDEIEQGGAHRAVLECPPCFHERVKFFGAELRRERLKLGIAVGRVYELQERHLKETRKTDKTVDRDAVGAVFIFLHLLERQVEKLGDLALALARGTARGAEIPPEIPVEGGLRAGVFCASGSS